MKKRREESMMQILEWIRFAAGVGLLLIGLGIFMLQIFGVFKFKYVLNRMHAAAMGDTLGIGVSLTGLILLSGFNVTSLKMALVIVFLWLASPVSSHLISRLEVVTNEHLAEHCELPEGKWEDELC
jgi:multicomponent Na+:H+ antiporter subunit G